MKTKIVVGLRNYVHSEDYFGLTTTVPALGLAGLESMVRLRAPQAVPPQGIQMLGALK